MRKLPMMRRIGIEQVDKIPVNCYDIENKKIISTHESYNDAAKEYGISSRYVRECCIKKRKSHSNNTGRIITFKHSKINLNP